MGAYPIQWGDLTEVERWQVAVIAGQFPATPPAESMAAIIEAIRLRRKK